MFNRLLIMFLLLFASFTSKTAHSQLALKQNNSIHTKIYKLDALQFQKLVQFQSIHDSLDLFTHYVKSVPINQTNYVDSLSYGHYIALYTFGPQVNYRLVSKSFFKLQSFGYNGEVWHIITDQEGNVLKDATVTIREKTYSYQADCNCYPVPVMEKQLKDTLQITYQNHYDFYKISSQYNQQAPYQVKTNKYPKSSPTNIRILPGYVAFNQPMYRKDDTVRVKAFLVNEKGKIWKKRKVLIKYTTPDGKTIVLGKVKRQSEGAYVKDFLVPESYPYGTYQLSFWKTWDEVKLKTEQFVIEDYQLNPANTFASRTTQKIYHLGQDVTFILKAVDVNGLALLDAKAKVTIQAKQIVDFYDKHFYWNGKPTSISFEKEVLFDVAGETVVIFPDSLFPNTNMVYKASIQYYNDLGDLYSNSIDFTFDAKPTHFEMKLKGDSIAVNHFSLGLNTPFSQLQLISMRNNEVTSDKMIAAPYREKIDLFNTSYILKNEHGVEIDRLNFNKHQALPVSLSGHRTHDAISIHLVNDLQMPISYKVFKRDLQIKGGQWQKGDSPILYQAIDSTLDDYHVFYSTLWKEQHFIKEQIFYSDETKLNVNINQPDIVFPGAKIPVSVKVTDYKNKGVEGANITAYAVNDLFNSIPIPNLPYFGRLHQGFLTKFLVQQQGFNINRTIPLTAAFLNEFNLREVPYYNFAYSKNGVGIYQDSIGGELAELAVYANNLNQQTVIHAVYLNNQPIAINGLSNSKPLIFLKEAGKYEVKIRTRTHLYTLKNISLIAGEKTYLCLNEAFIEGNPNVTYLKIEELPFTAVEWKYLKPSFLFIESGTQRYTLEQNGFITDASTFKNNVRYFNQGKYYFMVGPFKKGAVNLYNQAFDTILNFDFYPGYLYKIDSSGQMIIDKIADDKFPATSLKSNTHYQDWGFDYKLLRWEDYLPDTNRTVLHKKISLVPKKDPKAILNFDNPAREQQLKSFRPETFGQANAGIVNLKNNSGKIMKWVLMIHQTDPKSTGAWYTTRFNYGGLTAGDYNIMIFYTDSTYTLFSDFKVLAHGNNYYRIDSNEVKNADARMQLKYEEIIVNANKSPLNTFVNNPLYFEKIHLKTIQSQKGQTMLSGFIVNTYHKPLNNVNLIFEKAGKFKYGALTNSDGYFELSDVEPGVYTIKIGNYLPYSVYEELTVKRGVNNRIVIGNDPVLHLNKQGELEAIKSPENEVDVQVNQEDYLSGSYIDKDNINYTSAAAPSQLQRISALGSQSVFTVQSQGNTHTSTLYPNLEISSDSMQNQLDKYANQKGMDKATMERIRENDSLNRVRDNFRDYGYWVPNMVTDQKGNAHFTVEFPDNITRWKTIVPAMTGNKQTGMGIKYAQAFKPLSGHLGIPSFLIVGDSIQLEGKILNYTNETMAAKTWFKLNTDTLRTAYQSTNRTVSENLLFSWPTPDSITLSYGLKMKDGYQDGEERKLKVFTNSIEQIKGVLVLLDKDSVLNIPADQNNKSVYIYNKPLGIYETEINRLKNFQYGCNEQTASKLKALLLEQKMATALEEPFKGQKDIKTCIDILTKNQKSDGSFGWWGNSTYDLWVTAYVLDALNTASKTHKVGDFMAIARFLKGNLNGMQVSDRLTVLNTLASIPFPMDYHQHIQRIDTINLSLQDEFKLIYLKQQQDNIVDIDRVLNTYIQTPAGIYWGEQLFDSYINQWQTSALAYKILKKAGGHEKLMLQMRDYFLQLNPTSRSTIERATLLELFLIDELLANETVDEFKGEVWVNEEKITVFPYYKDFEAKEAIQIKKSGTRVNVQVNTITNTQSPHGNDSLLTVNSWFEQGGKKTDSLVAGTPITYMVNVKVAEEMKYVLLEIPIPATCIYDSHKAIRNSNESYRNNMRHITAISCASLPIGTHEFQVNLIPRYGGTFQALPVKVEEMYTPVNANYAERRSVAVKKQLRD